MDPRFPRSISAVRIASFVSTAAWIQGAAADEEVALPPEALNNFLRRHGVRTVNKANKARQAAAAPTPTTTLTPTTTPAPTSTSTSTPAPPAGEEDDDEAEEGEGKEEGSDASSVSSGDSGSKAGVSSATGSSGASSLEDDDESKSLPGGTGAENSPTPGSQAAIQGGDPAGLATVDPGPSLSPGALAAIIVWSIIGFVVILGLAFFFIRRRRRARQQREDDEARTGDPMGMQGAAPSVIEPPMHLRSGSQALRSPASDMMDPPGYPMMMEAAMQPVQPVQPVQPAYLRPESQGSISNMNAAVPQVPMDPTSPMMQQQPQYQMPEPQLQPQDVRPPSVAPSGQWMPVPPWQEEPPTWRDPHPWRTSTQPSVAPIGLPANPSPRATRQAQAALAARQQGVDRTTMYTAQSESTIFAYG